MRAFERSSPGIILAAPESQYKRTRSRTLPPSN
jgi:hypothetical protein